MSADTTKSTPVDIVARALVGSDWDNGVRYTDIGSREYVEDVSGRIAVALCSTYYQQAAASLRAILDGLLPIDDRTMGIRYAATCLERTAQDLEGERSR